MAPALRRGLRDRGRGPLRLRRHDRHAVRGLRGGLSRPAFGRPSGRHPALSAHGPAPCGRKRCSAPDESPARPIIRNRTRATAWIDHGLPARRPPRDEHRRLKPWPSSTSSAGGRDRSAGRAGGAGRGRQGRSPHRARQGRRAGGPRAGRRAPRAALRHRQGQPHRSGRGARVHRRPSGGDGTAAARTAAGACRPRRAAPAPALRLGGALAGLAALLLAIGLAPAHLAAPANPYARVSPASGFWTALAAFSLLATDALTRLRPALRFGLCFFARLRGRSSRFLRPASSTGCR